MNTDMNTMSEIKYKDQKTHTRFSTFIDHDVDEDLEACRLLFSEIEITMTWQLKYVLSADMQTHRSSVTTQAAI